MKPKVYYASYCALVAVRFVGEDDGLTVVTPTDLAAGEEFEPPKIPGHDVPDKGGRNGLASGTDGFVQLVVPRSFRLERKPSHSPDSLELSLRFADLPLDPRIIRSLRVTLFGGSVDSKDFGDGLESGQKRPMVAPSPENALFAGFADDVEIETNDGLASIRMRCRDFQGLLADTPMLPQSVLKLKNITTAKELCERVLALWPAFREMSVVDDGAGSAKVASIGESRKSAGRSVWDWLQENLVLSGAIPVVNLDEIHLIKPGDILGKHAIGWKKKSWPGDGASDNLETATFVMGHNVKGLRIKREFNRRAQPIEVRSFDPETGTIHRAVYPPESFSKQHPDRATLTGGDSSPHVISVPWVSSPDFALPAMAKAMFDLLLRGELQIEFGTRDLSSFGVRSDAMDVLHLIGGDTVTLLEKVSEAGENDGVETGGLPDTISQLRGMGVSELAQLLEKGKGFAPDVARSVAKSLTTGLPTNYYVRSVSIDHDAESGTDVTIEATEYALAELPEVAQQEVAFA